MLFTTAPFVLIFLPLTLAGFFAIARWSHRAAAGWLFLASLFFYGYWMPVFTWLLLASIAGNFLVGMRIADGVAKKRASASAWLAAGVAANLVLLGYFKYANFFVDNLNLALGTAWQPARAILPIGISFYSFTQIAFLVDTYRAKVHEHGFVHYGLFVTYFPHLVAGPVLHHAQMMPQFTNPAIYRVNGANFAAGLAIFVMGLMKKVVFADGVAPYADAVFGPADGGAMPTLAEAWLGTAAYTLQLYFDFSGYSDMAIGLSWMFNIRLPFNFDSPYRSTGIIEFWRCWHISLSNFLRDYLYIALGGNRYGSVRRYANLLATMVLGGLWHGAAWTFVFWGALHGLYLVVAHGFRTLCGAALTARLDASRMWSLAGWVLTMVAVMVAWIFFRAESFGGAWRMVQGLVAVPVAGAQPLLWNAGLDGRVGALWCALLGSIAVLTPNTNRIGERLRTGMVSGPPLVRGALGGAAVTAALMLVLINTARDSVSAFIYFNF